MDFDSCVAKEVHLGSGSTCKEKTLEGLVSAAEDGSASLCKDATSSVVSACNCNDASFDGSVSPCEYGSFDSSLSPCDWLSAAKDGSVKGPVSAGEDVSFDGSVSLNDRASLCEDALFDGWVSPDEDASFNGSLSASNWDGSGSLNDWASPCEHASFDGWASPREDASFDGSLSACKDGPFKDLVSTILEAAYCSFGPTRRIISAGASAAAWTGSLVVASRRALPGSANNSSAILEVTNVLFTKSRNQ